MNLTRRDMALKLAAAAGVAAARPTLLDAQAQGAPVPAPPARDFSPGAPPVTYPDPDVITIDPAFNALRLGNTPIQRLWTGALWMEGPAWCAQGRYLVWSDIPNNRQMRYLDDD